jgi:hypothetical protein
MKSTDKAASRRIRTGLLATAAGAAMLGAAGSAAALEYTFGDVKVTFDTTISLGGSLRVAERDNRFLPEANGGNADLRSAGVVLGAAAGQPFFAQLPTNLAGQALPARVTVTGNANNFDGSINADDGRLNFGSGDWIGASAKVNHDLLVEWGNIALFSRFYYFYDNVLSNGDVGRSGISSRARETVGAAAQLLDLYVSGKFKVGEQDLNIRLGRQVISWGEGTFILNGINVVNPIDVAAFRRPGAEIKEGLLPVNAAYASFSLPWGLSIEAFYQLKWEKFAIDPAGTPFSGADVVRFGNDNGRGNLNQVSYLTGSPFGGNRRNCAGDGDGAGLAGFTNGSGDVVGGADLNAGGFSAAVNAGILANPNCASGSNTDYLTPLPRGQAESVRNARGDADIVPFGRSVDPGNDGQFGVALRWYAEELNATEFGFYYVNYHSRLPYVQLTGGRPFVDVSVQGANVNIAPGTLDPTGALAGRFAPAVGCINPALGPAAAPGVFADPRFAALNAQLVNDPLGFFNLTPVGIGTVNAVLGDANPAVAGVQPFFAGGVVPRTIGSAMAINCALALLQSKVVDTGGNGITGAPDDLPMLVNGAETLALVSDTRLDLIYPKDIELWGFSFNTVVGGWGVQGEFSYRPSAPFQTDTDGQTIESATAQCAFPVAVADLGFLTFEGLNTVPGAAALCNPAAINHLDGVGRHNTAALIYGEMFTAQIGTTATFTTSNPIVEFLGADLGVFLTEFGFVYTPGVESTWLTNDDGTATAIPRSTLQYQNVGCQGSDLPLGGLLGLDFKPSYKCRPTNWSFGYVLLARLDYSNFAGSGWLVSPQLSFSHDVEGVTAAPYGNYVEDRMALSLSVSGTLENKYRVSLGYTNFFGGGILNKSTDQDFASFSFSYAF